jgi:hypothetical protein
MDVLRHTGRATLSSFIGGSASNRAMDRAQWQFAPYTDADLQRQFDLADDYYGDAGAQLQTTAQATSTAINAYVDAALANPTAAALGVRRTWHTPQPWSSPTSSPRPR